MSADRLRQVENGFQGALERVGEERAAFLDQACAGDADLRKEVESLLAAHEQAESFLESSHQARVGLSQPSPFRVGTRVGPYEILAPLGSGGMGEVYRARDDRLGRDVAIKVLPPEFASSPERTRRFEQEARAASALSHPHILTVYDVGRHEDQPYLVTELLAGETLAKRMARGRVPVGKALEWGVQAARGLTAVHEHGILHRDLKPSNLFVTLDGQLKILDFGLAKLDVPLGGSPSPPSAVTETRSGVLLGTVGYMSPEQVRCERLDARSDQFSLGCVLYELLTGQRPFKRSTEAESLAAVLVDQPPSILVQGSRVPSHVAWTVERCLAKDPEDRYAATRDLARDLELALGRLSDPSGPVAEPRLGAFGRVRSLLPWFVAAGMAVVAAVAIRRPAAAPSSAAKHFVVTLSDINLIQYERSFSLLPDGTGFAYAGQRGDDWRIHLHTLGDGASRPLPGTERGREPFFSPDGRWLGFSQDGKLKKVAVGGGAPVVLIGDQAWMSGGASWGPDDRIVVSGQRGLWRAPAAGGAAQALTTVNAAHGEARHTTPQILPDGKNLIFTVVSKSGAMDDAAIAVVSLQGAEPRVLIRGGASARYVSTGHLLYIRGTDLMAVRFDANRLAVVGSAVLVVPGVLSTPQHLHGQFDLAADGTLAYLPGGGSELQRTLVYVDPKRTVHPLPLPARPYVHPRLLPGGQALVVEIEDTPHNLWRADLQSGTLTQLTRASANHRAVLSPDGRFMAFSSDRTVPRSLFRQATDGSGAAERLLEAPHPHNATAWSSDGRWIAFTESHPETKEDIWVLDLPGGARPFLNTPFSESSAVFSPDGRWIAYVSNESGRPEVLLTAFPGPGPRKQVSTNGGDTPLFSRDGKTLFYRLGDHVFAAEIVTGPALASGAPRVVFELPAARVATGTRNMDVAPTGASLLAVKTDEGSRPNRIHVIVNWFGELRRLAPTQ